MNLKIFCDGASRGNPGPAASAFIVYDQNNRLLHQHSQYLGRQTNNFAEYTAVLLAYSWLLQNKHLAIDHLAFYLDSELVVRQLNGLYKIKSPTLSLLANQIFAVRKSLSVKITHHHVVRNKNSQADSLANHAIDQSAA